MRYLAIDYGKKYIGLAISDRAGVVAMPYKIILNSDSFIKDLKKIVENENIEALVVGQSIDFTGKENQINFEIKEMISRIKQHIRCEIFLVNESFTSMEAKWGTTKDIRRDWKKSRSQRKKQRIDDKAATMILKTFLTQKNSKKGRN